MPTAVENLANILRGALKLEAIDGADAQAAFLRADAKIDAGVVALENAGSTRALFAAERQYGGSFAVLGGEAFGAGLDLAKDAFVFSLVDGAFGGASAQADFAAIDGRLFAAGVGLAEAGADFAALGHAGSHNELIGLLRTLDVEAGQLQTEFAGLGRDVAQFASSLGGANADGAAASPYAGLQAALSPLAASFSHFADDIGAFGGGAGAPSAGFAALNHDLLAIDGAMQGLAAPIAGLLLPAVRPVG